MAAAGVHERLNGGALCMDESPGAVLAVSEQTNQLSAHFRTWGGAGSLPFSHTSYGTEDIAPVTAMACHRAWHDQGLTMVGQSA